MDPSPGIDAHNLARRYGRRWALADVSFSMAGGIVISGLWKTLEAKTWKVETAWGQIAKQLADQALLAVHHHRRAGGFGALPDLGPDLVERLQVADDVLFGAPRGRCADDDAARESARIPDGPIRQ